MQTSLLADDDLPDATSLVAAVADRASPGCYDEWLARPAPPPGRPAEPGRAGGGGQGGGPAEPAAHWGQFFSSLGTAGVADLPQRLARVRRRVLEDGASHNVHAAGDTDARPWPLELLPAIVPPADWALIEAGVLQRARLLEATMADLYGPQTLLRDALLPAALVYAHPQYLRAAHGLLPAGRQHLHMVAFDLKRAPSGRFRMLAQRVQAPSGLGYLLENRLIIGQQLNDPFRALNVQRLAGSFRSLLDGLLRASPAGARSRIVLLTPGPLNQTYFEQVFLARYLGITLVEGSDLTVRGRRLYLKTLRGLEQVHVVLRRVDDEFLDPLELRADSALGVPGLLQAIRAGEVLLANAPGAGVLESPGLTAFWPGVAERLLDEELLLPAATSWWCGEASVWRAQRAQLEKFVVAPTFHGRGEGPTVVSHLDEAERERLRERIDADPAAYTLQARVRLGETPVWREGPPPRLQPRGAVMRVFALADGAGGWRVLPGAFTRVAGPPELGSDAANADPWLGMQHGSASVDTWVITSGAVDPSSLLPKPLQAADLQDWHRAVTSRAAENLFWLGRYTERAENSARLVRVGLEALTGASEVTRAWLLALVRHHGLVDAKVLPIGTPQRAFEQALIDGLAADGGTFSVAHNLRRLRQCAQALRERLSPEHWKLIQEVDERFEAHLAAALADGSEPGHAPLPDVLGVLARATTHLSAITGAQTDRMTRDDGWRLMSVGRQIERLDMLAHALALGLEHRVHETDDGFALLLELFDSVITYRAQFQGRRELLPLLHLLVLDTDNPRSLAWVARTLRDRLRKLSRHDANDTAWALAVTSDLPQPHDWNLAELGQPDAQGRHAPLVAGLQRCSQAARQLSHEISRHLFAHVDAAEHQVWQ